MESVKTDIERLEFLTSSHIFQQLNKIQGHTAKQVGLLKSQLRCKEGEGEKMSWVFREAFIVFHFKPYQELISTIGQSLRCSSAKV